MSRLAELKELLAAHGLSPRKMLGQNFMLDRNFAAAIVRDAAPDEQTLVVEVGPGTGCLTTAILDAHPRARVLAIELDRGLIGLLRESLSAPLDSGRLTLLEGDALAGKHALAPELVGAIREISARENRPRRVLCANLPYNIATPLLANLALDTDAAAFESAIATVQLELAERLFAKFGAADYGALSVAIALRADGGILRRVGNEVFWPRPKVDSAVIRLAFRKWGESHGLKREEAARFRQFLQKLFQQRRKMLRAALKPAVLPPELGNARAEDLAPEGLLKLFRALGS